MRNRTEGHTPLPWVGLRWPVSTAATFDDDRYITTVAVRVGADLEGVAVVYGDTYEQAEANAALIEVAVNAREALVEAVNHLLVFACDSADEVDFRCDGCNAARAALALARGETEGGDR